jgi:4'-phosphopantetheinyl transferase
VISAGQVTSRPGLVGQVPVLALHDVHVWLASLDECASHRDELWQVLSPEERRRAARFLQDVDRIRFAVGRGILRTMLGHYLDTQPEDIELRSTALGKPEVAAASGKTSIQFNLSHSGGQAAYAFARGRRVGIDLEAMRPLSDLDGMVRQVLTAQEQHEYAKLPSALRLRAFYNCWTQKEALTKAIGDGLAYPLQNIEVAIGPAEPAQLTAMAGDPDAVNRWCLERLELSAEFVGAVAVEGRDARVSLLHYPVDTYALQRPGASQALRRDVARQGGIPC